MSDPLEIFEKVENFDCKEIQKDHLQENSNSLNKVNKNSNIKSIKNENSDQFQRKPFEFLEIEEIKKPSAEILPNNLNLNINELHNMKDDKEKWRYFSYMLAQSYDKLKEEYNNLLNESKTKDLVIEKLNAKIKSMNSKMKALEQMREEIQEASLPLENTKSTSSTSNPIPQNYIKHIQLLKEENKQLNDEKIIQIKTIEELSKKLKKSKEKVKKILELSESNAEKNLSGMYRILSEKHLNMCTTFADQVICLQTDLEKSNKEKFYNKSRDSQCSIQIKHSQNSDLTPKNQKVDKKILSSNKKQTFSNVLAKNNIRKSTGNSPNLYNTKQNASNENSFPSELIKNNYYINSNSISKNELKPFQNKIMPIPLIQKK